MTRRPVYRRLFDLGVGSRRSDVEMDLEIESHIAMRVADLVRAGISPEQAHAEAIRRFGDFDEARRRLHAAARQRDAAIRQRDRIGSVIGDIRYALRQARRAPGFTMLAVASLAIGIGAVTTMFTLVAHILLQPLPFPNADRLVQINGLDSANNRVPTIASADWLGWRHAPSLAASAISSFPERRGIVVGDSAVRLNSLRVSPDYFRVLGSRFVAGRSFTDDEIRGGTAVVVISERLWQQLYGGDQRLTSPLRTTLRSYTIIGVVARGQEFPATTDVFFPVHFTLQTDPSRINVNYTMIARLGADVTPQRAAAELAGIARGIHAANPSAMYDVGAEIRPLAQTLVGDAAGYLRLLMAVVLCVLLIVCANVAASGLARATVREREMGIRASLGAARSRLVQQMLIEHVLLGLAGGTLGLLGAWMSVRAILARWGDQIPRSNEVSIDGLVFLFAFATSLVAGVLAGIIPALRVSQVSPRSFLAAGGRTSTAGPRNLVGSSLVSLEIALALLLLTGAGLLVRSFQSVLGRDIGFDTNVATAEITLGSPLYVRDSVRRELYWNSLIEAYRSIPGVEAAGVSQWIPLGLTGQSFIDLNGRATPGAGAVYRSVSSGFFAALRVPLIAGRTFDDTDRATTQRVVVINRAMATKYWPGESPVGKLVRATSMEPGPGGRPAAWLTVIGVVGDVRTYGLESEPQPEMYVYYRQTPGWTTSMTVLVRGNVPASTLLPAMRRRARQIDPTIAVDVGTMDARLRGTLAGRVLTLSLLSWFAAIAVMLAALGIYGVLSYAVAQRARELSVRAALGAQRRQLLLLILRAGVRVVAWGALAGVIAAVALSRTIRSMLVDVTPVDPLTYAIATLILFIVALAAIVIPARRATGTDPVEALRGE
jgi:predicted permease